MLLSIERKSFFFFFSEVAFVYCYQFLIWKFMSPGWGTTKTSVSSKRYDLCLAHASWHSICYSSARKPSAGPALSVSFLQHFLRVYLNPGDTFFIDVTSGLYVLFVLRSVTHQFGIFNVFSFQSVHHQWNHLWFMNEFFVHIHQVLKINATTWRTTLPTSW